MSLSPTDFDYVRDLTLRRSGIALDAGKAYLVDARLATVARKRSLKSAAELLVKARAAGPAGSELREAIVEAMTTNETSFFRDGIPFEAFVKHAIPDLLAKRAAERRLNVWSAASSTGQEPYTLALLLREHFPQLSSWTITFVASDISHDVVAKARSGRYSQLEIGRGMPPALLAKYFRKDGDDYEVNADLKRMVDFRQINLLDPWPALPKFDVVFIRNVLIYFAQDTKHKVLGRVRGVMRPDGYLFLGAAETTLGVDDAFERGPVEKSGCYRLRPPAAAAVPHPAKPAAAPAAVTPAVKRAA